MRCNRSLWCAGLILAMGTGLCGCAGLGFVVKDAGPYNLMRSHVAATAGAYCDFYYCGSDAKNHYFNQSGFLGLSPTVQAVSRACMDLENEMPFTKNWREWREVPTGVCFYIWTSDATNATPACVKMGRLPLDGRTGAP